MKGSSTFGRLPFLGSAAVLVACRFERGKVLVSHELEVLQVNAVGTKNPGVKYNKGMHRTTR